MISGSTAISGIEDTTAVVLPSSFVSFNQYRDWLTTNSGLELEYATGGNAVDFCDVDFGASALVVSALLLLGAGSRGVRVGALGFGTVLLVVSHGL